MTAIMAKAKQQIFLARLTENHPVKSQPLVQSLEFPYFFAIRKQRNATLYPSSTILENPIRDEIGMPIGFASGRDQEESLSGVSALMGIRESCQTISFCDILSDCMTFISMNAAFALFKINWVRG